MSFDLLKLTNSTFWNIPYKETQVKSGDRDGIYFSCTLFLPSSLNLEIREACQCVVKQQKASIQRNGSYYFIIRSLSERAEISRLSNKDLHILNKNANIGKLKRSSTEPNFIYLDLYCSIENIETGSTEKNIIYMFGKLLNVYDFTLRDIDYFGLVCDKCLVPVCDKCCFSVSECLCEEEFILYEKNVELDVNMMRLKSLEIFDFSEEFIYQNIYSFNPRDTVENYLRSSPDKEKIQILLRKCDEFERKMHLNKFYLKKYPKNQLLCTTKNSEVQKLMLAPIFNSKFKFIKYFSLTPETSIVLSSEISKRLNQLENQIEVSVQDYLNPEYLKYSPLSQEQEQTNIIPGFYNIYRNLIKNSNRNIILQLPRSHSQSSYSRVIQEYNKVKQFKMIKKCLGPEHLIKLENGTGIIYNYSSSLSSLYTDMNSEAKIKVMKKVAGILDKIHEKKTILLNLHPDNIIFYKNELFLKDFTYATKSEHLDAYDEHCLLYMDPLVLTSKKISFHSDIWSWATVFISLFSDLDPYKDSINSSSPISQLEEIKQDPPSFYRKVYNMNKIPKSQKFPKNFQLINLINRCLDLNPQNRPSIKEIITKLNSI